MYIRFSALFALTLLFGLFFANEGTAKDLSLTFYNIGQGNCVVSNCPSGNSFIVDCGSSEQHNPGEHRAIINIENVKEKTRELSSKKRITIFLTHLDKDHYNLLPEIFNYREDHDLRSRIQEVIIAGTSFQQLPITDKTNGELATFNEWLERLERIKIPISFINNTNYQRFRMPQCSAEPPKILTSNVFSLEEYQSRNKSRISNGNGAILKISHGKCSAILTGDATEETTQEVIKTSLEKLIQRIKPSTAPWTDRLREYIALDPKQFTLENIETLVNPTKKQSARVKSAAATPSKSTTSAGDEEDPLVIPDSKADYKTTVLMMSHHGAESHGSNDVKWIYSTQPQITIVSAGQYGGYYHPRKTTYENFINTHYSKFLLANTHPHNFSYFDGNTLTTNENINLGIFNTYNSGNITVKFIIKDETVPASPGDHFTVKSDIDGTNYKSLINETSCVTLSGVPSSPARNILLNSGTISPGHGVPTPHRPTIKDTSISKKLFAVEDIDDEED